MDASKYREDFLWFTYFGIPRSSVFANGSEVVDALTACISRAYRDASRTMGYSLSMKDLKEIQKPARDDYIKMKAAFKSGKDGAGDYLEKSIMCLLNNKELTFDVWHERTCDELVGKAAKWTENDQKLFKDGGFTYGHAQKWINMSLKNMLVMGLWDTELSRYMECLHVPIDSYILAAAAVEKDVPIFEGYAARGLGVPNPFKKWSGIADYEEYLKYQTDIRNALGEGLSPIEWEGPAWIAQAKSLEN